MNPRSIFGTKIARFDELEFLKLMLKRYAWYSTPVLYSKMYAKILDTVPVMSTH